LCAYIQVTLGKKLTSFVPSEMTFVYMNSLPDEVTDRLDINKAIFTNYLYKVQ